MTATAYPDHIRHTLDPIGADHVRYYSRMLRGLLSEYGMPASLAERIGFSAVAYEPPAMSIKKSCVKKAQRAETDEFYNGSPFIRVELEVQEGRTAQETALLRDLATRIGYHCFGAVAQWRDEKEQYKKAVSKATFSIDPDNFHAGISVRLGMSVFFGSCLDALQKELRAARAEIQEHAASTRVDLTQEEDIIALGYTTLLRDIIVEHGEKSLHMPADWIESVADSIHFDADFCTQDNGYYDVRAKLDKKAEKTHSATRIRMATDFISKINEIFTQAAGNDGNRDLERYLQNSCDIFQAYMNEYAPLPAGAPAGPRM